MKKIISFQAESTDDGIKLGRMIERFITKDIQFTLLGNQISVDEDNYEKYFRGNGNENLPFCKCGCGKRISIDNLHYIPKYIKGHKGGKKRSIIPR